MLNNLPILGTWNVSRHTETAGTLITDLIPPLSYSRTGGPFLFRGRATSAGPINFGEGLTHLSKICYTTSSTAHVITVLRPLNWAIVNGAVAANSTALVLTDDPGVYSTNYKYPILNSKPATVADNALAANDYIAYQLVDGTWRLDKVSSGTYGAIVLATGTPNVTGGGIPDGSVCYFFGITTDVDPATGQAHPATQIASSQTGSTLLSDSTAGVLSAMHVGDPMMISSANGSNAGTLEFANGFYGKGW